MKWRDNGILRVSRKSWNKKITTRDAKKGDNYRRDKDTIYIYDDVYILYDNDTVQWTPDLAFNIY